MADEHSEEQTRFAQLRQQEEDRRRRKVTTDLRLQQQERQAQDEARNSEVRAVGEQYAELPRHSHTGVR